MLTLILFIGGAFHSALGNNITVCDCGRAEVIGLMDVQQPSYCDKTVTMVNPVTINYDFYVVQEPHSVWTGDMCMTWRKERKITGYFFGSFDTIDTMSVLTTTPSECARMVETRECAGNKMTQQDTDVYTYDKTPTGVGTWMQTVVETTTNCATRKIVLKKDCLACPVVSPYGSLTNNSDATSYLGRDSTIIWKTPHLEDEERCKLKRVNSATGIVTKIGDGSLKLVDESNQLEFHYKAETLLFCNRTFHKLANIQNAYIEFPNKTIVDGLPLFNRQHQRCLDQSTRKLEQCGNIRQQLFTISRTLTIHPVDGDGCLVFGSYGALRAYEGHSIRSTGRCLVWNQQTKQLTDGKYCLEAFSDIKVERSDCSLEKPNQQWVLEIEEHIMDITEDNLGPLLAQHHQFIEDLTLERENAIQKEIKEIYCDNLQLRRYTTQLLAESNGLIAARANNLPMCHRLKPNGVHLIVQKCKELNITVTGAKTKCGYEPKYLDFTIGRDGFSLHPFQECFWKDELVNLNGRSYTWNSTFKNFTLVYPTYHVATMNLRERFNEIDDRELEFVLQHHKAYDAKEFEQQNILNELVTRIHVGINY
jgi:hypothetical protein